MIPKIIHYCWFGRNPMPKEFQKYIKTWKKNCPDYEIKLWNEDNYDVNKIPFTKEAYRLKKWAFVTDYARIDIIEQFGGIYVDTDVELLKSLDTLLNYNGFAGFECSDYVNFGLIFGAEPHNHIVQEIRDFYHDLSFNAETPVKYTCPIIQTSILEKHGLKTERTLEQDIEGFHIFPTEFFCPMNYTQILDNLTDNSISIHHFSATWFNKKELKQRKKQLFKTKLFYNIKKIIHWNNIKKFVKH